MTQQRIDDMETERDRLALGEEGCGISQDATNLRMHPLKQHQGGGIGQVVFGPELEHDARLALDLEFKNLLTRKIVRVTIQHSNSFEREDSFVGIDKHFGNGEAALAAQKQDMLVIVIEPSEVVEPTLVAALSVRMEPKNEINETLVGTLELLWSAPFESCFIFEDGEPRIPRWHIARSTDHVGDKLIEARPQIVYDVSSDGRCRRGDRLVENCATSDIPSFRLFLDFDRVWIIGQKRFRERFKFFDVNCRSFKLDQGSD